MSIFWVSAPSRGLRLAVLTGALAGAFVNGRSAKAGEYYLKAASRTLVGGGFFAPDGDVVDYPGTFQDHQLRLYGSYSISDAWTVVGSMTPIGLAITNTQGGEALAYFGGFDAGVSWAVLAEPLLVSIDIRAGLRPPSGRLSDALVEEEGEGFRAVVEPVVGTAVGRAHIHLERGFGWGWIKLSGGGHLFSAEELEPALEGFLQLGFKPDPRVFLDAHVSGWYAFGELAPVEDRGAGRRRRVNVLGAGQSRYVGFGLSVEWWLFGNAALAAGLDIGPFAEANAASPSISLGLAFRGGT